MSLIKLDSMVTVRSVLSMDTKCPIYRRVGQSDGQHNEMSKHLLGRVSGTAVGWLIA